MATQLYNLNGPVEFVFPFSVRTKDQLTLEAVPGGVVPPAQWDVFGEGPQSTGVTVRWPDAPRNGQVQLRISRRVPPERVTDFSNTKGVTAAELNDEFDNIYRINEDLTEALDAVEQVVDGFLAQVIQARDDAQQAASDANDFAIQAGTFATNANTNRIGAENAATAAEGFRDAAEIFRNQAEQFKIQAEEAEDNVVFIVDELAFILMPQIEAWRDETEGFRDEAQGFRNEAEGFKNAAEGFADDANDSQIQAGTFATNANTNRIAAENAAIAAEEFKDETEGFRDETEIFRNEAQAAAQDSVKVTGDQTVAGEKTFTSPLRTNDFAQFNQRVSMGDFQNEAQAPFGPSRLGDGAAQVWGDLDVSGGLSFKIEPQQTGWALFNGGSIPLLIAKNFNSPFAVMDIKGQGVDPSDTSLNSEATLALYRGTDNEQDSEFVDFYNNGYWNESSSLPEDVGYGIRMQKRGSGEYRPFRIEYSDGTTVDVVWTITPDESVVHQDLTIEGDLVVTGTINGGSGGGDVEEILLAARTEQVLGSFAQPEEGIPFVRLFVDVAFVPTWSSGQFFVVGRDTSGEVAWASDDGQSWFDRTSSLPSGFQGSGCGYTGVNNRGFAFGTGTERILSSANGLSWRVDASVDGSAGQNISQIRVNAMADNGSRILFVGQSTQTIATTNNALYSDDGVNFTPVRVNPDSAVAQNLDVAWCGGFGANGLFVGVNNQQLPGQIWRSEDGTSFDFTQVSTLTTNLAGVAYSPELNIAVACGTTSTRPLYWSDDGINWTFVPTADRGGAFTGVGVRWIPELKAFLLLNQNTNNNVERILISYDGKVWQQLPLKGQQTRARRIAFNGRSRRLCLVTDLSNARILTSNAAIEIDRELWQ